MADHESSGQYGPLIEAFESIRSDMLRLVDDSADLLRDVHPDHQLSARNLLHYLALRSRDLRPLQERLATAGLSSLGRAESHVLAAVEAVRSVLLCLSGQDATAADATAGRTERADGQRLLDAHTQAVLGPRPAARGVSIMVTMPTDAARDPGLVDRLLEQGMDCMRVNCAHDTVDDWARMIDHLHRARERTGRPCRILMDLAGPKVRTGPLEPGPAVVKFRPRRDVFGRVVAPARIWLCRDRDPRDPPSTADAALPVADDWLGSRSVGETIRFTDTRGASRSLRVVDVQPDGCWAESTRTAYVETGTRLRIEPSDAADASAAAGRIETRVGQLPSRDVPLTLFVGDELILSPSTVPGRDAVRDEGGRVIAPARIGCTSEQIFVDVRAGDRILFDDGRIAGLVERSAADGLHIRVERTPARGARLGAEKGINLPDTTLQLPALTAKDREDLAFATANADMVALSFVNSASDVRELRTLLESIGGAQPAIVLKIETRRGFENLPAMLLEAMKSPRCAVMIARGDLAVECGFERLAEVQEEILWLCEAAHVPVIWATQVLETLAKEGMPSRAEVTDAAMAHRAECVMLNKGPYVVEAVAVLDDILRRMHGHQAKKQSMLRELRLVSTFREARSAARGR